MPKKGEPLSEEARKTLSEKAKQRYSNKANHPCFGKPKSAETRKRIGDSNRGNSRGRGRQVSEETRRKISESAKKRTGDKNSFFGKHHTQETKDFYSKNNKGRSPSIETRNKISKSLKGKKQPIRSEEWCEKLSKSHMGKTHTEETKQKISKIQKGRKRDPFSEEHRHKLSLSKMGKKPSIETRMKMSTSRRGRPIPDNVKEKISKSKKGKTVKNGSRKPLSEETKRRMKFAIRKLPKRPTKPELKLFEVVKSKYPNMKIKMDYGVKTQIGYRFIDVAIPELRLGFEYDEPHWHKNKERDQRRHEAIEAEGWKLTHYIKESEFTK